MKVEKKKKNSEKAGLKLNIQSTKITESHKVASVLWQIEWENMERVTDFVFFWAPKSLEMMTTATKLKDVCSLEEKL